MSNNTMADRPPTSTLKSSYANHREMHVLAENTPPSPPSPCASGCACFLLPTNSRRVKKQKHPDVEQRSNKIKVKIQQGKAHYDRGGNDTIDQWQAGSKEAGPQQMDAGGLFDVKSTEKEFKRVSMKEKQLTEEAQKLLKMVANS